jgi:hypothetical protein
MANHIMQNLPIACMGGDNNVGPITESGQGSAPETLSPRPAYSGLDEQGNELALRCAQADKSTGHLNFNHLRLFVELAMWLCK